MIKEWCTTTIEFDCANMIAPEIRDADLNIFDFLFQASAKYHRHGEPLQAGGRFDSIALLPGLLLKLDIVQENKRVHLIDQIKIPEPREVGRLCNRNFHFT